MDWGLMRSGDDVLGESAARIARLVEASAPGIWDWDISSGRFAVTSRLRDIFGFSASEIVTMDALIDATHPADRAWEAGLQLPPDSSIDPRPVRFRIVKRDTGQQRWLAGRVWRHRPNPVTSEVSGYSGTVEDITDQIETAQALTESEERLRLAIEAGKMAVWEVDLLDGTMTQSPELNILCGFEPDTKVNLQDVRALYDPGEIERLAREGATVEAVRERAVGGAFEPWRKGALKSGSDRTQIQAEVAITTPSGVPKRLMLRAQYAVSPEGRPRLTGLLVDITEGKLAEERLAVVARELQHRVKNSLSVIRAIAVQSLKGKSDPEAALHSFLGRLSALAVATDLVLERSSSTADLSEIVEKITRPYRGISRDPFLVKGESIPLSAKLATAIGMVLHELCTNAVKYGALSATEGKVSIDWRLTDDAILILSWREFDGPSVVATGRKGFGSRLLENVLSGEMGGKVVLDFDAAGLRCHVEVRL